jgi:nucleoid-associated protein YgaU
MANLTKCLTSISPNLDSGPSPGRRLLAVVLCAMLALGSVSPGIALAGEADSEGEGTALPVEVPEPPDFDPGGEETDLEEAPASGGGEESGAVETEPEVDIAAPSPEEVTSAITEAPIEAAPPQPAAVPEPATAVEPVQQQEAPEPITSEPVANQSIVAPKPIERHAAESVASSEAPSPVEPAEQEAPPAPQPVAATPAESGRNLAGKDSYVVRPGDCLSHIAQALLPASADEAEIASEVARLWRLNEGRIGTGDPDLIYPGTVLRLR